MNKLTKDQAAVIGAFTGVTAGPFRDVHEYAERKLGRPCFTHEFGSEAFTEKLREAARPDFLAICHEEQSNEA